MITFCKWCFNTAEVGYWDNKDTWKRPLTCPDCNEMECDCECFD